MATHALRRDLVQLLEPGGQLLVDSAKAAIRQDRNHVALGQFRGDHVDNLISSWQQARRRSGLLQIANNRLRMEALIFRNGLGFEDAGDHDLISDAQTLRQFASGRPGAVRVLERGSRIAHRRASVHSARVAPSSVSAIAVGWWAKSSMMVMPCASERTSSRRFTERKPRKAEAMVSRTDSVVRRHRRGSGGVQNVVLAGQRKLELAPGLPIPQHVPPGAVRPILDDQRLARWISRQSHNARHCTGRGRCTHRRWDAHPTRSGGRAAERGLPAA